MTIEQTTERPKDKFGIVNHYSPEAIFALLTQDHRSRTVHLDNNLGGIVEGGYDPFNSLFASVSADLKYKFDNTEKSRYCKVIWFEAQLRVGNLDYLTNDHPGSHETDSLVNNYDGHQVKIDEQNTLAWLEQFHQAGLDFDVLSSDWKKPMIASLENRLSLYLDRKSRMVFPSFGLGLDPYIFAWCYDLLLPYQKTEILSDVGSFEILQESFFRNLEKVIRVTYKAQEKDLPPVKLVFKPKENAQKEFIAACSYCGINYFTAKDLKCPGCGASSPQFLMEK